MIRGCFVGCLALGFGPPGLGCQGDGKGFMVGALEHPVEGLGFWVQVHGDSGRCTNRDMNQCKLAALAVM